LLLIIDVAGFRFISFTALCWLFEKAGFRISGRLKSWLMSGNSYSDAYICQKFL